MTVRTRIEPIERDIALILAEDLSPEAQSRALANFARQQLEEAQVINERALGRRPDYETFVDGSRSTPIERVRSDGTIVFEFELLDDLFGYVDLQLIVHSPTKSGRYRRSHVFLADGVAVDPQGELPPATEYVYVNTQPYSRKIERGHSRQAPDGVYQVVAALASRRFGNMARIKFGYRTPMFGAVDSWANSTKMARGDRRNMKAGTRAEWLRRQPAIIVTLR